jgi:hypothetical protein
MVRLFRFALAVIVCACIVSLTVRYFTDLDARPDNDPINIFRGIGTWTVAVLLATLNELLIARRDRAKR